MNRSGDKWRTAVFFFCFFFPPLSLTFISWSPSHDIFMETQRHPFLDLPTKKEEERNTLDCYSLTVKSWAFAEAKKILHHFCMCLRRGVWCYERVMKSVWMEEWWLRGGNWCLVPGSPWGPEICVSVYSYHDWPLLSVCGPSQGGTCLHTEPRELQTQTAFTCCIQHGRTIARALPKLSVTRHVGVK